MAEVWPSSRQRIGDEPLPPGNGAEQASFAAEEGLHQVTVGYSACPRVRNRCWVRTVEALGTVPTEFFFRSFRQKRIHLQYVAGPVRSLHFSVCCFVAISRKKLVLFYGECPFMYYIIIMYILVVIVYLFFVITVLLNLCWKLGFSKIRTW